VGGLRFHVYEWGAPSKPAVAILHGLMGNSREWDLLAAALASDFRVLSIDQRGHGATDWAGEYTAGPMIDDLAGLLEAFGIERVTLVGHSLGAMIACLCAAGRPELVERLVLIDIGPDSTRPGGDTVAWLTAFLEGLGVASYAHPQEAVDEWLANDPLAREELMRHYVEHSLVPGADGRLVWRFDARRLSQFLTEGTSEAELWRAVDRVEAPTLLVRGAHSEVLSPRTAAEMVRRLHDARFVEIPGGAHDLGVEQPEAVAEAVRAFLV